MFSLAVLGVGYSSLAGPAIAAHLLCCENINNLLGLSAGGSFIAQIHRQSRPAGIKARRSFVGEASRACFTRRKDWFSMDLPFSRAHCSSPQPQPEPRGCWRATAIKTEHKHRDLELFLPCLRVWSSILGLLWISPSPWCEEQEDLCPELVSGGSALWLCLPIPAAAPACSWHRSPPPRTRSTKSQQPLKKHFN